MRGTASADGRASRPRSLMQRLALVAAGIGDGETLQRPALASSTTISFGVGVFASTVVGGIAFLGLVVAADSAAAPPPAHRPLIAVSEPQPDAFDMVIDRGAWASAPFGLRLSGSDNANVEVILRDVPPATWLSRGERRDEFTWALKAADLSDLHLTLHNGTPDAFDVRIDVVAPPGIAAVTSVARVRLVDAASNSRSTATVQDRPADAAQQHVKTAAGPGSAGTPALTQTPIAYRAAGAGSQEKAARPPAQGRPGPTAADVSALTLQAAPQPRPWPESASALGATARESERQVWWKMPPPSWSPFQESAGRP